MSSTPTLNLEHLRDWIGRSETRQDTLHPNQVAALAARLESDVAQYTQSQPVSQ